MKATSGFFSVVLILFGVYLAGEQGLGKPAQTTKAANADTLTCSGPPCILPPTQASEGGGVVTDTPIVTNPTNHKDLLLGSFDANCSRAAVGFYLSTDGGSTWQRVLCMPFIYTKLYVYYPADEPSVGYDRTGVAYAGGIYFANDAQDQGFVAVQRSSEGMHWSNPVTALRKLGQTFPFEISMAVDASPTSPWVNSVYVSGVMWSDQGRKNQVLVSHSNDGGATWNRAAVEPIRVYPEEDDLTRLVVGETGTVYIAWMHCKGACQQGKIVFSKSDDRGTTWSLPQQIAPVKMPDYWQLPNTKYGERVYNYPMIAVDNSNGPHSGNIYAVMYTWTGTYLRVQVTRSSDGGKTWSQPVPLAPKSDTHDQFFPAISVNSKGVVGVSWLDRRNDPANHDYQAFAAFSTDGGKTFSKNWQLTQAFSDPDADGLSYSWMGDYTGNTWMGDNVFIAAWMDSSNGAGMQEVVGGVRLK